MSIKKTTRTVEEVKLICDFCGEHASTGCESCGKHVCWRCSDEDPDDGGMDYPRRWCRKCFKIGEPFMKTMVELEEAIDAGREAWRQKCREVPELRHAAASEEA